VAGAVAGVLVQRTVISGSIAGGGRSFAQVERYSAELSDLVTRGVGTGIEELVFVGWLTPLLAVAGLVAVRKRRGLAAFLGLSALIPCVLGLGSNVPLYEPLWHALPPLRYARVPERLMPIACLAIAALVACALDAAAQRLQVTKSHTRTPALTALVTAVLAVALAADLRVPVFAAVAADRPSAAYAAIRGDGRLLELPVFRPDIHFGSVYLGYARQSPRERPEGYSTTAPPAADHVAREIRGLSCGRGLVPSDLGVRFVVIHGALYRQSGFFAPECAARAEEALRARGWRLLARDGLISSWRAP
jgi:hypothetical protein